MDRKQVGVYLCSLPERILRSISALSAGAARELGEVVLPARVRRSKLYDSMVESTLRFLIEQVGQVDDVYAGTPELPPDFLVRRTAGNVFEIAGMAAFHASPVWVLSALADLAGAGAHQDGHLQRRHVRLPRMPGRVVDRDRQLEAPTHDSLDRQRLAR